MTDEPAVVPIRAGATIRSDRARQLLDHVAENLAAFTERHDEDPLNIVFVIHGDEGTVDTGWLVKGQWRAAMALSGAVLVHDAAAEETGDRCKPDPDDVA
jgi:hypothetical protein